MEQNTKIDPNIYGQLPLDKDTKIIRWREKKKVISSNGAGTNGDSYAKRTSIYTSYHIKHFQNNHQA